MKQRSLKRDIIYVTKARSILDKSTYVFHELFYIYLLLYSWYYIVIY
jgi:hypothetical protein